MPRAHGPKTSWEQVSDWYAGALARADSYQQTVVFPNAMRLLAPICGGAYLDLACGDGAFTRLMAKTVSLHVVGIDASPSLIERARRLAPPRARYEVDDVKQALHGCDQESMDGATIILALQNIDEIEPVLRQTAHVLKHHAPLVIVLNHPCFRQPRQSSWGWDEPHRIQYRRLDRYLTPYEMTIIAHPGAAPSVKTFSYHRSMSTYVLALHNAGFMIDTMEEWTSSKTSDSGPRAQAENTARDEFPLFLAIRANKQ